MPKETRDLAIIVGIFVVLGAIIFLATAALPAQNVGIATPAVSATKVTSATPDPQATAFSNVELDSEEQAYLNQIAYQSQNLSDSFYRFSDLTSNSNVSVDDPSWISAVKAELNIWHQVNAQANGLTAPSRFTELHAKYLAALEQYDRAATDIAAGLDNRDTAAMQKGGDELQQGNDLIGQAADELEKALSSSIFSLRVFEGLRVKPLAH